MLSDRPLIYGVNYAKPQPPNFTRAMQLEYLAQIGCKVVREGIGLRDIWKPDDVYDWNAETPAVGITYVAAVEMSVNAGITVVGNIVTTPDWALGNPHVESMLTTVGSYFDDKNVEHSYIEDANREFSPGTYNGAWEVVIVEGPGSGQLLEVSRNEGQHRIMLSGKFAAPYPVANESGYQLRKRNHKWPPNGGYEDAFFKVCKECALKFRDQIHYWEFWNEPNTTFGWHEVNAQEYSYWLDIACRGIKEGNPSAVVCMAGLDGNRPSEQYIEYYRAVRNHAPNRYEAVALHPYGDHEEELRWSDVEALHACMNEAGSVDQGKPIWFTEYGWSLDKVTQQVQNVRLANALTEMEKDSHSYVTISTWLSLLDLGSEETQVGLLNWDQTARLSYHTFSNRVPRWSSRVQVIQ